MSAPLLLLVGGGTGTGKSTLATEVAHRLGITRVTSTDVIRQTLRGVYDPDVVPSVHRSSFEGGAGEEVLASFLDQTRHVLVGVSSAIERVAREGWSMVLEGVHLVPGMVPQHVEGVRLVHVVVAIEAEELHAQHFVARDEVTGGLRPHHRYLDRFAEIRRIQSFIVGEAHRLGVPVIENSDGDEAVARVLGLTEPAVVR